MSQILIRGPLRLLQIAGLNPTKINFYENFKCGAAFVIFVTAAIELILASLYKQWNFKVFLLDMVSMLACQQAALKICLVVYYRQDLIYLIETIINDYWITNKYGEEVQKQIEKTNTYVKATYIVAIAIYGLSCIMYLISPLVSKRLPIVLYYPSQSDMSLPVFIVTYIYELYILVIFGMPSLIGVDMLITSIIMFNLNELKLIKKGFTLLGTYDGEDPPPDPRDNLAEFKSLIEHHSLVLDSLIRVQNVMSLFFLDIFASTAIIMCLCMLGTIIEGLNLENMLHYMSELIANLNILYLYCYLGTLITSESTNVYVSIYESNWLNTHVKLRKDLVIPMMVSQKGVTLTATDMVDVNLDTFTQVLKMSYNFFTLVQAVMAKKKKL